MFHIATSLLAIYVFPLVALICQKIVAIVAAGKYTNGESRKIGMERYSLRKLQHLLSLIRGVTTMTASRLVRCVPIALMMFLIATVTARADWTDTFDGGFDQTWVSGNVNGVGGASGTFSFAVDNDILKMTDPTVAAVGGAASGFGFVPAESFLEVHMSAVINPNAGSYSDMNWDVGLLARFDPLSSSAYALTLDLYKGQIDLTRIDNGATGAYFGSTPLSGFQYGTYTDSSIVLKFDLVGDQISGAAYDLSGNLLTAPFSTTDATYSDWLLRRPDLD